MSETLVKLRDPWAPHILRTPIRVDGLRYGFVLNSAAPAGFRVSRANSAAIERPDWFEPGGMVTCERTGDNALPYVGFLNTDVFQLTDGAVPFACLDYAGLLFEKASTPATWPARELAAGVHIRQIFAYAEAQAQPPLMVQLDFEDNGPVVTYQPKAESLISFLQKMSRNTGWEWEAWPEFLGNGSLRMHLRWQERLGHDYRTEVVFAEKVHFENAQVSRSLDGVFSTALVVGGSGEFASRPARIVSVDGEAREGIGAEAIADIPAATSPAQQGTQVEIEPTITNEAALAAHGRRLYGAPERVRHRLSLRLVESTIDMETISLGSIYRVTMADLFFGQAYDEVVRAIGITLGQDGVVEMIAEVYNG